MTGERDDFITSLGKDPYPVYERLRKDEPVRWAADWTPPVGEWLVTRWDDVEDVLRNANLFGPADDAAPNTNTLEKSLATLEGDEHRRVRRIVQAAIQSPELQRQVEPSVRKVATDLLDGAAAEGVLELVRDFALPLSAGIVRHLLGLDQIPIQQLITWCDALALGLNNYQKDPRHQAASDRASREITELLPAVLDSLDQKQMPAILPTLFLSDAAEALTAEEIIANTKIMLIAIREPGDLLALVTWALLSHPEQAAQVAGNPSLMKAAVDETLRWSALAGITTRQTKRAVSLHGSVLPEGALVGALIRSANRDDRRWTAPSEFNVQRREGMHLAFGSGAHVCPGAWLARTIARAAVNTLFEKLPNLRFAQRSPCFEISGWPTRKLSSLWLEWDT
jgi:cytochrome P450